MTPRTPTVGDVLRLTRAASVQFQFADLLFRVIRVDDRITTWGWVWLEGYELDPAGVTAVERRTLFVRVAGLQWVTPAPSHRSRFRCP